MVRIYEFMERAGIRNQQDLANRLGLTQSAISAWNSGVRFPTYETCAQLLQMGMTVYELFGVEYTEKPKETEKDDFDKKVKDSLIRIITKQC